MRRGAIRLKEKGLGNTHLTYERIKLMIVTFLAP